MKNYTGFMKLIWTIGTVILAVALTTSLSCTRHPDQTTGDRLDQIQQKIDHQEYAEAEAELRDIIQAEPNNERARVILASVFVRRAGITIKDYFILEQITQESAATNPPGASQQLINTDVLKKLKVKTDANSQKILDFLNRINDVAVQVQDLVNRFDQVPSLNQSQADDFYRALTELEKLQTPSDGSALYRGVLKFLYFKYLWTQGKFLQFGDNHFCGQLLSELSDRLDLFSRFGVSMVLDVAHGFPKERDSWTAKAMVLQNSFQSAEAWIQQTMLQQSGHPSANASVKDTVEAALKTAKVEGLSCDF